MNIFHCSLLNRHWFFRASEHWKDLSIVAFATGIFKKMPRYFIYKNNTLFNSQKNKSGSPCLFTNLKYISSIIDVSYIVSNLDDSYLIFFGDQTMCTYRQIRPRAASYMSRQVRSLKQKIVKKNGDAAYIFLKGSG